MKELNALRTEHADMINEVMNLVKSRNFAKIDNEDDTSKRKYKHNLNFFLQNLTQIAEKFKDDLKKANNGKNGIQPSIETEIISTLSLVTSTIGPNLIVDFPFIETQRDCPQIVIATFSHSQWSLESEKCHDLKRDHWYKSVFYQFVQSHETNIPRLVPFTFERRTLVKLLTLRGTIRINDDRYLLIRNDLSCGLKVNANVRKFSSGFNIRNRTFVQTRPGIVEEYGTIDAMEVSDN